MMLLPLIFSLALLESPFKPDLPAPQVQVKASAAKPICAKETRVTIKQRAAAAGESEGIANLPFAMGRRFGSLDAYLAHLECHAGPIDLPWWREIEPGVYEHMTTATNAPPREIATRAELMRRFGFSR